LEEIKRSFDPIGTMLHARMQAGDISAVHGLFYTSMFSSSKAFQAGTCESLIIRFGEGSLCLNFRQFCQMFVFLKDVKTTFCKLDVQKRGALSVSDLSNAFVGAGMAMPQELVVAIGRSYDADGSGTIEFDEFIQMVAEWGEMWKVREEAVFQGQTDVRIQSVDVQKLMGSVRVLHRVVNGAVLGLRSFSLNTCRWLVAKFGNPLAGETFAQGVTFPEFLQLIHYVKDSFAKFVHFDTDKDQTISSEELARAMQAYGLNLSSEAIENVRRSFDVDNSGRIEFDEFLHILMECQVYDRCFETRLANPTTVTPLSAQGLVTLDKSAFFSMVFAVPRPLADA